MCRFLHVHLIKSIYKFNNICTLPYCSNFIGIKLAEIIERGGKAYLGMGTYKRLHVLEQPAIKIHKYIKFKKS